MILARVVVHCRLVGRRCVRIALASLRVLTVGHEVRLSGRARELLVLQVRTVLEDDGIDVRILRHHSLLLLTTVKDASLRVPRVHGRRPTVHPGSDRHVVEFLTLIPRAAISSRNLTGHLTHARHGDHLTVRNPLFHLNVCYPSR